MLNTYNNFNHNHTHNHNISINSCSGGIYKTYKESWFKRFNLKSELMDILSNHEKCRYNPNQNKYGCDDSDMYDGFTYRNHYDGAKPIVVLQMVICGEMEVIAEIMYKEDFDKYFEDTKEVKENNE